MAWEISSKGFLMTLSGYVPQLIEEDITALVNEALQESNQYKRRHNALVHTPRRQKNCGRYSKAIGAT